MSQSWTWPPVVLSDGAVEAMKWLGLILIWVAGTAGLTLINGNGWACASFAVLAAMASVGTIEIPKASRWSYVYYPAHLSIILLLGFRIQSPS